MYLIKLGFRVGSYKNGKRIQYIKWKTLKLNYKNQRLILIESQELFAPLGTASTILTVQVTVYVGSSLHSG